MVLTQSLVDSCKAGDRAEIVGVLLPAPMYQAQISNNDTSVHTFLLAFSVKVAQREQLIDLTLKQPLQNEFRSFISQIQALAPEGRSKSVPLLELLADSLAPSIYGHKLIKKAVVLQLLGGIRRQFHSTIVRGDINILLIGSPGCGKS